MIFSSPVFLFIFLPFTILIYFITPKFLKNSLLLVLSLIFYTWGEGKYLALLLTTIVTNYGFGLLIFRNKNRSKLILILGVIFNLSLLGFFKYSTFFVENISFIIPELDQYLPFFKRFHLPLGISFFTFQSLSYIIDVYRGETPAQKSLINYALLIALFPHQIAGPIIRYKDIADQLSSRSITLEKFSYGIQRFIIGLSKKMLLANTFAYAADEVFKLPPDQLGSMVCWLGIVCYSLQIYYDFSGYSDMAIGLGAMFGFHFLENFNFPYIAKSIQEFWRRWHISLSSWFRDYVYIPLGGSRKGTGRTYVNLMIVFFLTGFWHGASWTFILWGFFHGFFITMERLFLGTLLEKGGRVISHLYTLIVVMVGWVLFRADDLPYASSYIKTLFIVRETRFSYSNLLVLLNHELIISIVIGIVFLMPVVPYIKKKFLLLESFNEGTRYVLRFIYLATIFLCFFLSVLYITSNTYNPFIYFRF